MLQQHLDRVGFWSVRSTSSIKCFFRLSGGEETRRIEDIPYTPFNTDGFRYVCWSI